MEIGRGAFGDVYKATHKASKKIFAIKKIKKAQIIKQKMESQLEK